MIIKNNNFLIYNNKFSITVENIYI
jgi:hypothetical protein